MRHSAASMFIAAAYVCAFALAGSAQAQAPQTPPPDPVSFETEIVVTPERGQTPRNLVPASTAVLDSDAIAALPVAHPAEIVSYLPGFNLARPQFHAGRPVTSARGFFGGGEAEYVLLLVDGVPVADVESGLIDWSVVPSSSIRRIEASRGPGASLYGDSAVGGVIQILTDRPAGGGQLTATGGSFYTFNADGAFGRRVGSAGFNVLGAVRSTDGGYEHSGGRQLTGGGSVDGEVHGYSWRWNTSADDRNRDDPGVLSRNELDRDPYSSNPIFRFDNVDRHSFSTAFTLRHSTPVWRPQARVHVTTRNEDLIRTILLAPGLGDRRARDLGSVAFGGSLEGDHEFSPARPVTLRFGVDLSREHLDTIYRSVSPAGDIGSLNSEASGHRVRAGAFASTSWAPVTRLRVSGAIRRDHVADTGFAALSPIQDAWSPRAGATYQLTDSGSATLYAQVSKAFKVPTLDQLFDPRPYPDFAGGTFTISNPGLVPQRATNLEAGLSGGGAVRWSALAYRMSVDNEIDFDVQTFSYGNIGQSRHVGLELEGAGQWKRLHPSVSYAFSKVTDTSDDRQLKNVPRHLFTVAASIDLPWAISAYARYLHTSGAFLDEENAFAIDGPSTLDIRVRRPLHRHSLFLDILNATRNVYEDYGFTLADFRGGVVPYAYPGAPMAVRAGVTLSF